MEVLVTEAASTVAYHLLQMLASGDVLSDREKLHLVLCDRKEKFDEIQGVAMELQDCLFPNIAGISTSCDFCEAFRSAELAIVLPSNSHQGNRALHIGYSILEQRDFGCLDGALKHISQLKRKDTLNVQARGSLSTAIAIADHIRTAYHNSVQTIKLQELPFLSSVQIFGFPGIELQDEIISDYLLNPLHQPQKKNQNSVVLVYALERQQPVKQKSVKMVEYYARL